MSGHNTLLSPGRLAGVVGLTVALCAATPATAQPICGLRDALVKKLWDQYREVVTSRGLGANGSAIEVYSSDNGSFTVVMTHPNGVACLIAVGDAYHQVSKPAQSAARSSHGLAR